MNRACEKSGDSPMLSLPPFALIQRVSGIFGDPKPELSDSLAEKKSFVELAVLPTDLYDRKLRLVRDIPCGDTRILPSNWRFGVFCAEGAQG